MRVAHQIETDDREVAAFHAITVADRSRLSGPALRTFRGIAESWRLTEKQRIAILGEPARSTYHHWMKTAQAGQGPTLPLDTLLRLSGVFGVWAALETLFQGPDQSLTWLNSHHSGTLFGGETPMIFLTDGALDGIMTVRRHLEGLCEGGGGTSTSFMPVTEDDLILA